MAKIIFVGGSSGDPGLLTMSGANALAQAEIVFYDRLINPLLLLLANPQAELVDVGKNPDLPGPAQIEISSQLITAAQKFQSIVRLKGGDPSIFGRLDEELQAVKQAKLDFEIIPGITAASALGAYSSVSLTQRGISHGVTLITGQQIQEEQTVLNQLIQEQTLVVYMGVHQIAAIQQRLLAQFPKDLPVLIGQQVSYGRQRLFKTTLINLVSTVHAKMIKNPALFLFGAVAQNYEATTNWAAKRPLAGETLVLVMSQLDYNQVLDYAKLGADVWPISLNDSERQRFEAITKSWCATMAPTQVILTEAVTETQYQAKLTMAELAALPVKTDVTFLHEKGIH
ncbi:uroporphyrinogen-III C-methyltransferase [Agrilactobacillus yilanensis]|uniref:uroporphyrinogen-III C-methyltransferase n=1 Tax=Agrilactobacillus yilanensis TaxID=2485997 RepID=A0ABW4JAM4_9LACO|nr:uroporphyrinogen-III C-methyltransferase [Agrilactobacillus yilanensis]